MQQAGEEANVGVVVIRSKIKNLGWDGMQSFGSLIRRAGKA